MIYLSDNDAEFELLKLYIKIRMDINVSMEAGECSFYIRDVKVLSMDFKSFIKFYHSAEYNNTKDCCCMSHHIEINRGPSYTIRYMTDKYDQIIYSKVIDKLPQLEVF